MPLLTYHAAPSGVERRSALSSARGARLPNKVINQISLLCSTRSVAMRVYLLLAATSTRHVSILYSL
jgi:hypothetical protein